MPFKAREQALEECAATNCLPDHRVPGTFPGPPLLTDQGDPADRMELPASNALSELRTEICKQVVALCQRWEDLHFGRQH